MAFTDKCRWQNYFTQRKFGTNISASWNEAADCKKPTTDSIPGPELLFEQVQSNNLGFYILLVLFPYSKMAETMLEMAYFTMQDTQLSTALSAVYFYGRAWEEK